jgi:triacylglycerol esterase/lipase EstA (alpha/beta hydrolase family)
MVVRVVVWILAGMLLTGCAGVKVVEMGASDYMSLRRGDILSAGKLSTFTRSALQVVGVDDSVCTRYAQSCRDALMQVGVMDDEQRLSALSELWLQEALVLAKGLAGNSDWRREEALLAYVESARYAYAYLFMTERKPAMRALEDRQTQVRDYYNFSVQRVVTETLTLHRDDIASSLDANGNFRFPLGPWMLNGYVEQGESSAKKGLPQELVPAASLTFKGLRNIYRRDGVGAELVAVRSKRVVDRNSVDFPWSETPFPAVSVVMSFGGTTLEEVLHTKEMTVIGYDPYRRVNVQLEGTEIPLAANFTSAYGLWLARSGFASQALLTLVGRGDVLERPHVYMMQPYDPDRRIIVMLHGLASSPEAWINVANEVLGDEALRQHYQIWQVYYPTNMPMIINHHEIQKALEATLKHVDPTGTAEASKDIVLIGHSMGGVLSRLMVSSSTNLIWDRVEKKYALDEQRLNKLREKMGPYGEFRPLEGVSRAVFIATPHRGTPIAENRFARWISSLITLPVSLVTRFAEMTQLVVDPTSAKHQPLMTPLSSIGSLSDKDPFMQMTHNLALSPDVAYHSIIGNNTPNVSLDFSDDGVVPYNSAHLPGAVSEKIVPSWHSVQETPEAIVEIRRILRLHLQEHPLP